VRRLKQQPTTRILSSTNVVPDATLISNRNPDGAPVVGDIVVGGRPPSDDAGWEGGGASVGVDIIIFFYYILFDGHTAKKLYCFLYFFCVSNVEKTNYDNK
jgi:hypothetical protein